MRAQAFVLLSVLGLTASACVTVDYIPMNAPPHPMQARSIDQVEMFEGSRPERPFVEVAAIEVQQQSGLQPTSQLTEKLREEAANRGCDGVIIVGANDRTNINGHLSHGSGTVTSTTLKGYRATCIVYKDAPAPAPMPESAPASTKTPATASPPATPATNL